MKCIVRKRERERGKEYIRIVKDIINIASRALTPIAGILGEWHYGKRNV